MDICFLCLCIVTKHIKISEEDLISLLADRKTKGMEILYDNYSAALYGVIYRITRNDEVAEDVLQDSFLKIWNNFSQYDSSKGRLFTWMVNIVRNQAIDKVRSKDFVNQSQNQQIDMTVSFIDESKHPSYNPDTIGLKEMVNKLGTEYKQVIDLIFFEGYSQSEAAEKLNIPLGTIKTRSRTAIMKLRELFETVN
jgi:RNA polymerase sigma factor (sigma-70 family)